MRKGSSANMTEEKKNAASGKSFSPKRRRSIASRLFSRGEAESGIPNIQWEKHGLSLAEIVESRNLPCLVATTTVARVAALDVTQPLLLFSQSTASQAVASCVSFKTDGVSVQDTENLVVIPESYPGWFQVLQFPNQKPFFFASIYDALRSNYRRILIGGNDPVVCYRSCKERSIKRDRSMKPLHRLQPGVVLTMGELSTGVFKKKGSGLVRRKTSRTEGEAFLQCLDEGGTEVLLPAGSKGTFYPVQDRSGSISVGLVKMEDVVRRLALPCFVRLVWGPSSASSKPFSDVLQLQSIRRQRVATLLTVFSGKDTIVSMADTSSLKFSVAREDAILKSDSRYRAAIRTCRQFGEDLETSIKLIKSVDLTSCEDRSCIAAKIEDRKDGRQLGGRVGEKSSMHTKRSGRIASEPGLKVTDSARGLRSQDDFASTDSLHNLPRSLPMDVRRSPTPTFAAKYLGSNAVSPVTLSRSHAELSRADHHGKGRSRGRECGSELKERATFSSDEENQTPVSYGKTQSGSPYVTMHAAKPPKGHNKRQMRRFPSRSLSQLTSLKPPICTSAKGHIRTRSECRGSPLLQFRFDPEDVFDCSSASTCSSYKISDHLDDTYDKICPDFSQEVYDDDAYAEVFKPESLGAGSPAYHEKTGSVNAFSPSPISRFLAQNQRRKLSLPTDDRIPNLTEDKGEDVWKDPSRRPHHQTRRCQRSATTRDDLYRRREMQLPPDTRVDPTKRTKRPRQRGKRSDIYEPHVLTMACGLEVKIKAEKASSTTASIDTGNNRDKGEEGNTSSTVDPRCRSAGNSCRQTAETSSSPPPCPGPRVHVYVNDDDEADDQHHYAKLNPVLPRKLLPPRCPPRQRVYFNVNGPAHTKADPDYTAERGNHGAISTPSSKLEGKETCPETDVGSRRGKTPVNYVSMIPLSAPLPCAIPQDPGYVTFDHTKWETKKVDAEADRRQGITSSAESLRRKSFLTGDHDTYVTYDPFGLLGSSSRQTYDPFTCFDTLGQGEIGDWANTRLTMSRDFCDGTLNPPRRGRLSQLM